MTRQDAASPCVVTKFVLTRRDAASPWAAARQEERWRPLRGFAQKAPPPPLKSREDAAERNGKAIAQAMASAIDRTAVFVVAFTVEIISNPPLFV